MIFIQHNDQKRYLNIKIKKDKNFIKNTDSDTPRVNL